MSPVVRFHRRRSFELILQNPRDARRRGFFFSLTLEITAPVDAESGMSLNLVIADRWMDEILESLKARPHISAAQMLFHARGAVRPLWKARAEVRDVSLRLQHREATFHLAEASDEVRVSWRWSATRPNTEQIPHPCWRQAEVQGPLDGVDEALQFLQDFAQETDGLAVEEFPERRGFLPQGYRWIQWREEDPDETSARGWEPITY